jgi:phosphopantothenoylcysteine decarboxylase/phosphopantothenate--cysteine ligase
MRLLITAGGTREYIDPVRFISNASSGRMGYALAHAALKAGHQVTLITAPTALKPPARARIVRVRSAAQMFRAVKKCFPECDCLIMAAAVADYTPAHPSKTKIRKDHGPKPTLHLKRTPDILKWAGRNKEEGQILVGFALEDEDLRARAEKKLREKRLDMIVANGPSAIEAERSDVQIKVAGGAWLTLNGMTKTVTARRAIRLLEQL